MKKPLTVKEFLSNNKFLVIFLIAIFVFSLLAYIIIFWGKLYDVSAWGSLVAGIFTYIGSTFLGIFVFYNTQSQQREKEIDDQIVVDISYISNSDLDTNYFVPFVEEDIDTLKYKVYHNRYTSFEELKQKNDSYLFYEVTNRNTHIPVYVEPISIYVFNGKRFIDANYNTYYSNMYDSDAIDYKQTKSCYIGTKIDLLPIDYYKKQKYLLAYVALKLSSIKGQVQYVSLVYFMGKTLGLSKPVFDTEEGFKNRIAKFGAPVYSTTYLENILKEKNQNKD